RLNQQISNLETSLASAKSENKRKEDDIEKERIKTENQWKGVLDERSKNWEAKEKALGEKISDLEGLVRDLKASYEVAQKNGDTTRGSGSSELGVVNREVEWVNLRLVEVEGRNEELRSKLAKATAEDRDVASLKELEEQRAEATRYHAENLNLLRKLHVVQSR